MDEQYRRGSVEGDANLVVVVDDDDDERVSEWEAGLPNLDDLAPLSQLLIPRELATAFSISPEPYRTLLDVTRASDHTISSLRANSISSFRPNNNKTRPPPPPAADEEDRTATMMMIDDDVGAADSRKLRRLDATEEADSALRTENSADDQSSARALKRPRLVWTPQLHKRFVEVVIHLGINNAVPKTVMQMMNVDGLTRENVASHLQKYRLFLKRRNEGPAISDHLFPSEPHPNQLCQQQQQQQPPLMPMVNPSSYHPFDTQHHFNMMQQQHHQYRDWSSTSNYASLASPAND